MRKVILVSLFSTVMCTCFGQNKPASFRVSVGPNFFTSTLKTAYTGGWGFNVAYTPGGKNKSVPEISFGYNQWNSIDKSYFNPSGLSLLTLQFGYRISLAHTPLYFSGRAGVAYNTLSHRFYFNPAVGLGYHFGFKNGNGLDLKVDYQFLQNPGIGFQGFLQPSIGYKFRLK